MSTGIGLWYRFMCNNPIFRYVVSQVSGHVISVSIDGCIRITICSWLQVYICMYISLCSTGILVYRSPLLMLTVTGSYYFAIFLATTEALQAHWLKCGNAFLCTLTAFVPLPPSRAVIPSTTTVNQCCYCCCKPVSQPLWWTSAASTAVEQCLYYCCFHCCYHCCRPVLPSVLMF